MSHTKIIDIQNYYKNKLSQLNDVYGNDLVKEVTLNQKDHKGYPSIEILLGGTDNEVMTTHENKRVWKLTARIVSKMKKDSEEETQLIISKIMGEIIDQLDLDPYLTNDSDPVEGIMNTHYSVPVKNPYQEREFGFAMIQDIEISVITDFVYKN